MELWTEYEGRTIDGVFPLKKLLLPEGRSAFFSTSNGNGVSTVIRLIASHFDEEEILARWRGVQALGHPNILKIEQYGQMVLDDTTVVYAVFEPVDANLAEVIAGQQLVGEEARQLAVSVASALEVLHGHGFVHEHVKPANVFAVGEVVKLRGDCIRETPEGEGGQDAKRRDVHDLALVLQRALTPTDSLEAANRARPLPIPFDGIVRNGLSGAWGLTEILAALGGTKSSVGAAAVPVAPVVDKAAERSDVVSAEPVLGTVKLKSPESLESSGTFESRTVKGSFVPPGARSLEDEEREGLPSGHRVKWMAAVALGALLLIWLIWYGMHGKSASQSAVVQGSSPANSAAIAPGAGQAGANDGASGQPESGSAAKPAAAAAGRSLPAHGNSADAGKQWRVVAFTYNRADQAQKKADAIRQKHSDLRPEVFSPTGRAPYLVTVGGAMNRDQAFALAERARRAGLPRDTYAQNYEGKRR